VARLLGQARDSASPTPALRAHPRSGVPVYGSGGFTSYDDGQTRDQLAAWVEKDHIPRVKIKIGQDWGIAALTLI